MEQTNQKKTRRRVKLVLLIIILFLLITAINLRGSYLEYLSIGENYIDVFWTNINYKYMTMAANFVVLFLSFYITTRVIKRGLKNFFEEEKIAFVSLRLCVC